MEDLEKFTQFFYGYGNINSDIWFIGHEEGSKQNSINELDARVKTWKKLGKKTLCDCREFHLELKMGNEDPFTKGKRQATWSKYIEILKEIKNLSIYDVNSKKKYLQYKFARNDSDHALIELFPIPCSNLPSWNYSELAEEISYFDSKENYRNHIVEFRLKKIIDLIDEHKPKIIIFNGVGMGKYETLIFWEKIINDKFNEITHGKNRYFFKNKKDTNFFIIPKLIYASNEIIYNVGRQANKLFK
jgi:hypothetical protein